MKKKKEGFLEVEQRRIKQGLGRLSTGTASKRFQDFLKKYDLDLPRPKETGDIIKDIKNNIIWLEERRKWLDIIVDYYKSTYARGMTILDEIIQLDMQIIKRERRLQEEGKDPLEDDVLQKAKKRKFEMMQYLDKMKFDKEKFYVEQKIKDMKQVDRGTDKLFVVEADYETEDRYKEELKKKDK